MCRWGTDKTVNLCRPQPFSGRKTVAVDACLAQKVQQLNLAGIQTTGCCCGHGRAEPWITIRDIGGGLIELKGHEIDAAVEAIGGLSGLSSVPSASSAESAEKS